MKRFNVLLILMATLCIGVIANVRVLSICISEYPESSGWNKINAHNDVELIKSLFPNAVFLENSAASHSEIVRQLKELTKNVGIGDTVIIHFSGHGQQILTQYSAEEADGVDEAIVPYDAGKRKTPSYQGQNHLTDDAFGNIVDRLRKSVGSNGLIIAVIDACHSDSMDKDAGDSKEMYRGTDEIFGADNMSDEEIASLREVYHKQDMTPLTVSTEMGNVIYLSACRSDQRNYEIYADGKCYGSLTYYFCKSYKNTGLSDLPTFLSALYSGMNNDKTLKFHGQRPAIRNTIGWAAPAKVPIVIKVPQGNTESTEGNFSIIIIRIIIGVGVSLIFIALCITKKKKK